MNQRNKTERNNKTVELNCNLEAAPSNCSTDGLVLIATLGIIGVDVDDCCSITAGVVDDSTASVVAGCSGVDGY